MEQRIEHWLEPRPVEAMERGEQVQPMMAYARKVGKFLDYDAAGVEQTLREVCRRVRGPSG